MTLALRALRYSWVKPAMKLRKDCRVIKLVLSDMDGTLVPFGCDRVSLKTLSAIDVLREANIRFGLSSGREWHDATSYFHDKPEYLDTCIAAAGKQVRIDGTTIFEKPFSRELVDRMVEACRKRGDIVLITFSRRIDPADPERMCLCCVSVTEEQVAEFAKNHEGTPPAYLVDSLPEGALYTVGVVAIGHPSTWDTARDAIAAEFPEVELVRSADGVYDVNPGGWNKADALPILLDALGIDESEAVYVGDSENDVPIMKLLTNTVAVAGSAPACLAAARYVIGRADEDAPAALFEALATHGGDLAAAIAAIGA